MKILKLNQEKAKEIANSLWYRHIDNTVIAVIQDFESKDVLMVGYMNKEAVIKTLTTGFVHFWSTTRKKIWMKGETSGNVLYVLEFRIDCDKDAVLIKVKPTGPVCHLGYKSCFDSYKVEN